MIDNDCIYQMPLGVGREGSRNAPAVCTQQNYKIMMK